MKLRRGSDHRSEDRQPGVPPEVLDQMMRLYDRGRVLGHLAAEAGETSALSYGRMQAEGVGGRRGGGVPDAAARDPGRETEPGSEKSHQERAMSQAREVDRLLAERRAVLDELAELERRTGYHVSQFEVLADMAAQRRRTS